MLAAVGDGVSGIELALKLEPDIVLLDMRMPDMDGIGVLKQYRQDLPVVMLTTSTSEQDLLDALKHGAEGYLLKDMEPDALVTALRDIGAGETVVASHLTSVLVPLSTQMDVIDEGLDILEASILEAESKNRRSTTSGVS